MKIHSTYKVKIQEYTHIFEKTVDVYRNAVDFFIRVCVTEWNTIEAIHGSKAQQMYVESICHATKICKPKYNFDALFYKMPCYIRRAAISEAIGKVSSYTSNYANWMNNPIGKAPSLPKAGYIYPTLYRDNMYTDINGNYTCQIKAFIRNTWDWIEVRVRKSDVDYIHHHCSQRKMCAPTLRRRGRNWYLDFSFEETVTLSDKKEEDQIIIGVDLGITNPAVCVAMKADGTICGRHFLKLPSEQDHLNHALNKIKKAQQHGNRKTPRLWGKVKGINDDIAVKTATFIMEVAHLYHADVIVFEALEVRGKKRGSKKQRIHHWRANYVQEMVINKAHRQGMRVSHVLARGTSKYAYDGSGKVRRSKENHSICTLQTKKEYNCDLSAAYNIGARYFIRYYKKSMTAMSWLEVVANDPSLSKRSTCTLSSLISLHAVLSTIQ